MRLTRYMAVLVLVIGLGCWSGCASPSSSRSPGGSYPGGSENSHTGCNH